MQENILVAELAGEAYSAPPDHLPRDGADCPLPKYPTSALGLLDVGPLALAPDPPNMMGWIRLCVQTIDLLF